MDNSFEKIFKVPPQFQNPQDEIEFLRKELERKEALLDTGNQEQVRETITRQMIREYKELPKEHSVIPEDTEINQESTEGIALRLKPESHDDIMAELLTTLLEKGLQRTLSIVEQMNSPHIDDDFHRFLVQYLAAYHTIPDLKQKSELYKSLDTILFEVTLPEPSVDNQKTFKELIATMEQWYAGMQAIGTALQSEKNIFTLEIALSDASDEIIFYASVPRAKAHLFEKQILGLFPDAKIEEVSDDYNIFHETSKAVGGIGKSQYKDIFRIRTYDAFDADPLRVILNVFSKLKKQGEGASIQYVIRPVGDHYIKKYGTILDRLKKGESLDEILEFTKAAGKEARLWLEQILNPFQLAKDSPEASIEKDKKIDENAITSVTEKLTSTIVEVTIRIVAAAETTERAHEIYDDLASAFYQFTETQGNGIVFEKVPDKKISSFVHAYSYRLFDEDMFMTLNLKELATLYHFPTSGEGAPQLKQSKAGTGPAPLEMGTSGIVLGKNSYRGKETPIHFLPEDRMRHFYMIGQTGVGKTTLFLNMIIQDIKNGDGVCYIDPHGTDINTILANIPPERMNDVIYFDPAYTARPMGLNMLEYDERYPEQKSFVVGELMSIFDKLFDMKAQGGAMFGQYFRNSALLVMEHPESGNTLLEITRVLASKEFRDMKLRHCKNPIITEFWKTAEETTGDQSLANFVPYISSKFDDFISNEIMRPVVLQEKSSFNFRKIMDEKKILLVNLSKGRLGEKNANLIGLVLVGKLQMAALSRVDSFGKDIAPFYTYIDEFQNITTDSISSILSEARKYKLSLNITHQYLAQLQDSIKNAVFGNVGSMATFRVSSEDAKFLEPRFAPAFSAEDITKIDNWNAYVSMLIGGKPTKPFSMATLPTPQGNPDRIEDMKQLSYLTYGRPRDEVESEIQAKYRMM